MSKSLLKKQRLKKQLPKEFKKLKEKAGKRLKPSTRTRTEIHEKTVAVLRQNLHEKAQPTTEFVFQQFLRQLGHPRDDTRLANLQGAMAFLQKGQMEVSQNLGPVIASSLPLLTDDMVDIRKAVVELHSFLMRSSTLQQAKVFFPVLGRHLWSSLTHLSGGVQSTALSHLVAMASIKPEIFQCPMTEGKTTVTFGSRVIDLLLRHISKQAKSLRTPLYALQTQLLVKLVQLDEMSSQQTCEPTTLGSSFNPSAVSGVLDYFDRPFAASAVFRSVSACGTSWDREQLLDVLPYLTTTARKKIVSSLT
ncbi:MAG: uncharacterized protein KVP18_003672 [Porospora cf. gigantea A]|uniref:uncharacterized protein n=1 Tax=Porospora cf. gigantea A TaxID=2853593 RepID=UPI00355A552D|nr:MAG: hypothetical protein KVP18_003672 [Porospora cf. gigantea A]